MSRLIGHRPETCMKIKHYNGQRYTVAGKYWLSRTTELTPVQVKERIIGAQSGTRDMEHLARMHVAL